MFEIVLALGEQRRLGLDAEDVAQTIGDLGIGVATPLHSQKPVCRNLSEPRRHLGLATAPQLVQRPVRLEDEIGRIELSPQPRVKLQPREQTQGKGHPMAGDVSADVQFLERYRANRVEKGRAGGAKAPRDFMPVLCLTSGQEKAR